MFKDVLVHLDGTIEDRVRLAHAESLTSRDEGCITGLFTNLLPSYLALPNEPGAKAILEYEARLRAEGEAIAFQLRIDLASVPRFLDLRKVEGPPKRVQVLFAREARIGDILVATCPYRTSQTWDATIEAALFSGGPGLYLVPPGCPVTAGAAVIAWTDTREACRAVAGALPILRRASKVHLVMVDDMHHHPSDDDAGASRMAAHLGRHKVPIESLRVSLGGSVPDTLLDIAERVSANLVVAGAYGHSRVREWIIGGTTRELAARSEVPLYMAH